MTDEGIAAARLRGDHATLSRILRARSGHIINKYPGEVERAVAFVDAAVEAGEASGDAATLRAALMARGNLVRALGRIAESEAVLAHLEDRMEGAYAFERFTIERSRSSTALAAGDLDRAAAHADAAVALAEPMGPHNKTHGWDDQCDVWSARSARSACTAGSKC